ncbi:MAG: helix-turn-helix transcriptional regulator [Lachnospiraceae bacterium]|nr:helix-turn-helix transcriptional regulator [Lachnospiraceae bacterium]
MHKREKLIEARGNRSQKYISSSLGITQQYLSKIEKGYCRPSLKVAYDLSSYYGISINELFPDLINNK